MIDVKKASGGNNSTIIQSGGNTNIGFAGDEVREIISSMADLLPKYAAIASDLIERRLKTFEQEIVGRFAQGNANPKAFVDPDFLFVVSKAQRSYARTGSDENLKLITEILAKRSIEDAATRRAMVLNEASTKASLLTRDDVTVLAAMFRYRELNPENYSHIDEVIADIIDVAEMLNETKNCKAACEYIDTLHLTTGSRAPMDFFAGLKTDLSHLISDGIEPLDLRILFSNLNEESYMPLFKPCINAPHRLQLRALNHRALKEQCEELSIYGESHVIWHEMQKRIILDFKDEKYFYRAYPILRRFGDRWNYEKFGDLMLGMSGLALGYIALSERMHPQTQLYDWI